MRTCNYFERDESPGGPGMRWTHPADSVCFSIDVMIGP